MPKAEFNLEEYMFKHNQYMEFADRANIFDQVVSAMEHAHDQTIFHRDLSPTNVLIFRDGEKQELFVKVSDFGLGKNWTQNSAFTHSAAADYGTRVYAAPEVLDGLKKATHQSDIFSLGKILDYILTGKIPSVTRTKGGFKTLIDKATESEPADRYQDIASFRSSYEKLKELIVTGDDDDQLTDFKSGDGTVDWIKFHRFVVTERKLDNIFREYIIVVADVLGSRAKTQAYFDQVSESIAESAEFYWSMYSEMPTTGWPYSQVGKIGSVFENIYSVTESQATKVFCFEKLWVLAYEEDFWDVQGIVQRILNSGNVSDEIDEQIAAMIIDSNAMVESKHFEHPNVPKVIKSTLR